MFCYKCGKEIGESNFCPFCGEKNTFVQEEQTKPTYQDDEVIKPLEAFRKRLAESNAKKKTEQDDPDKTPPKYWEHLWIPFILLMIGFLCLSGVFFNNNLRGGGSLLVVAFVFYYLFSTATYGSFSRKKIQKVLIIACVIALCVCWI